jgi:hypothetical protein
VKVIVKESFSGELDSRHAVEKLEQAISEFSELAGLGVGNSFQKHTCDGHEVLEKAVKTHDHRVDAVDEMVELMRKAYEKRMKAMVKDIAKRVSDGV